ncbi:MAG: J domain-containing protein [Proteobacteria bacterium]|nr:J domain-containing protein [Pseudomonadota bacterium]
MPIETRRLAGTSGPAPEMGAGRRCSTPGCEEPGLYRAPISRHQPDAYYWFCLDHVRDYNKAWNYFEGMNEAEIEAFRRLDVVGHRPTWPLGSRSGGRVRFDPRRLGDGFGRFFADDAEAADEAEPVDAAASRSPALRRALSVLDLDASATLQRIKARYKELVKRHHPDANGGDKRSEERLKDINQAYAVVLATLSPKPQV